MAYYYRLGEIPPKRHTQFRQPDGSLYKEELVSSKGFSGIYSNLYHINAPTRVKSVGKPVRYGSKIAEDNALLQTHLKTTGVGTTGGDWLEARKVLLKNKDVSMALCNPSSRSMDYFYKNAEADEVIFIHDGSGWLLSQFGKLRITSGDYVVIPRTTIYKLQWDEGPLRTLVIESAGAAFGTFALLRKGHQATIGASHRFSERGVSDEDQKGWLPAPVCVRLQSV
jgi:homogentisate 1,2-dioxygenase